jgi:hypothetical protein
MRLRRRNAGNVNARTETVRRRHTAAPPRASNSAISAARFAIFVTIAGWLTFTGATISKGFFGPAFSLHIAVDATIYIVVVSLLAASALAYLLARRGYLYRTRTHHRASRVEIDTFFDRGAPSLTVLVPSYCEEPEVIRQTLLSAALQEYPEMRVVLLIDDPPNPSDLHRLELLEHGRALSSQLDELLSGPRERFTSAYRAQERRDECKNPGHDRQDDAAGHDRPDQRRLGTAAVPMVRQEADEPLVIARDPLTPEHHAGQQQAEQDRDQRNRHVREEDTEEEGAHGMPHASDARECSGRTAISPVENCAIALL